MNTATEEKEGVASSECNPSQLVEAEESCAMEDCGEWDEKEHQVYFVLKI